MSSCSNLHCTIPRYSLFIYLLNMILQLLQSLTHIHEFVFYLWINAIGYLVHYLRPVLGLKILKLIYFFYVHSVLNYGIVFWHNSPHSRSTCIFITRKQIVRIIMKAKPKDSCIVLYLLSVPAYPYKTEATGYRTCHITNLL
jgi:hypothetical protein